jgi:hypothetical protein
MTEMILPLPIGKRVARNNISGVSGQGTIIGHSYPAGSYLVMRDEGRTEYWSPMYLDVMALCSLCQTEYSIIDGNEDYYCLSCLNKL